MKVAVPSEVNQVLVITRRGKKSRTKGFHQSKATFFTKRDADGKEGQLEKRSKIYFEKYKFVHDNLITSVHIENLSYSFPQNSAFYYSVVGRFRMAD